MNLSDLQKIKEQVSIRDVAESLLHLEKQDGKYKYPGERTASIQLYTDTQSFNDFGRNVGGDIFKLVSHIEGIDFKESLDEIVNFFQIRDVENKDEESSRPRWINYLEEKKKCRYIEHYNYSLISLKGEYLGYAFTKVRVMHQIKKKDDNGDEVLIWDKTLIYGTLNGDYMQATGRAYVNPTSTDAYKGTAEKYNTESQKLERINGRLYSSYNNLKNNQWNHKDIEQRCWKSEQHDRKYQQCFVWNRECIQFFL